MSIVHLVGSGESAGVGRTPFTGHRLPEEIRQMLVAPIHGLDKATFRILLRGLNHFICSQNGQPRPLGLYVVMLL